MEGYSKSYFIQKRSDLCVRVCRSLYRSVHGREASIEYRKRETDMKDPTLTFGEIVPHSFLQILKYTSASTNRDAGFSEGRVFVDLGSGTGRACVCAALSPYGFHTVVGVELMPALCEQSNHVLGNLNELLKTAGNIQKPQVSGAKVPSVPSPAVIDLNDAAVTVLKELSIDSKNVAMDYFANHLTKRLGHKVYKVAMKEHKSLSRYVSSRPALFALSADSKTIQLAAQNEGPAVEIVKIESNIANYDVSDQDEGSGVIYRLPDADVEGSSLQKSTLPAQLQDRENVTNEIVLNSENSSEICVEDTRNFVATGNIQLTIAERALLNPIADITFHCGDMFQYDWSNADVVYAASLLFSTPMMEQLTIQASSLKPGSWIISLKPLLLEECAAYMRHMIELRTSEWFKMSWQMAKVFIYQVL